MDKKTEAAAPASIIGGYDDTVSAYSLEHGPPAYHFKRQESSSVKITRLVAGTIVLVTLLAGIFYLLGTYIDARTSCRHLQNKDTASLLQHAGPQFMMPSAEARIAPASESRVAPPPENRFPPPESRQSDILLPNDDDDSSAEDGDDNELGDGKFRFPLTLSMDDIGDMMHRNQRAQVNCLVEKKKAEEIVTETPKHLETPFGNLTTDPRYVHVTGEAVFMSCRTGGNQRSPNQREGRINTFNQGPMAMSGAMPTIHVIPLSASGRILNGRVQNQDQSLNMPHPMMGPPMPFPVSSRHDMINQHEPRGPGPVHRASNGIPLPMMTQNHQGPQSNLESHMISQNHQGPHGPHGLPETHMPLVMGQPMHNLQPRSTEFEDEEVESRRKRSLASCSCACK